MMNSADKINPKQEAIKIINGASLIVRDINCYLLLNSELSKEFKKNITKHKDEFGGGQFLSLIGTTSVIGFLSKVYSVLKEGQHAFTLEDDIKKWEDINKEIKKLDEYCKFKEYFKKGKPRLGEINETEAFVKLMIDFPNDLGVKKEKTILESLWKDLRNQSIHMLRLPIGNMAINSNYHNSPYSTAKCNVIKNEKYTFSIKNRVEMKELLDKLKKHGENLEYMSMLTNNNLYVDRLNCGIINIMNWLKEEIKNDKFSEVNMNALIIWYYKYWPNLN